MDEFPNGYKWSPENGKITSPELYDFSQHLQISAFTGSGKGICLEMPALLQHLRNSTVLNMDPSGQNAAVCAAARRAMGHEVWHFNPDGVHVERYPDLACMGFNAMDAMDPANPARFSARARAIGEAWVPMTGSANGRFFEGSGAGLVTWVCKFVKLRDGDNAHLGTVRDLICEAEVTDEDGVPIAGLRYTAMRAVAMGDPDLASAAGRYVKETRSNNDVIATVETESRCFSEPSIRAALSKKNGISFEALSEGPPKTIFATIAAGTGLSFFAPVMRLFVNCFLDSVYAQEGAGRPVVLLISEAAQIGKLDGLLAAYGQGRKYKLRVVQVWQNIGQITEVFGPKGASTVIANSAFFTFNPGNDPDGADFLSRLGGERLVPGLSASDDPLRPDDRGTIAPQRERVWSPERIRSLPERHGLVWKGREPVPQPVYTPPYWDIEACRRVARPDPYHPTLPPRQTGPRWRLKAAAAVAAVVLLAAAWLFNAISLAGISRSPVAAFGVAVGAPAKAMVPISENKRTR
jgi:type IV secretory pathway TraG/TraD family ATPase VirD4